MVAIRTCSEPSWLAFVLTLALASSAAAQERSDSSAAARHFDRGYLLAQQGSLEAAIAEFRHAYALSPHPSVLYNLGQAYAASGRAVEAVQTLRKYLEQADPELDTERRAQAAAIIDYQGQRIGSVELEIEPAGAELILNGELLGRAPLGAPLRLTAGSHGLTVAHAGYTPRTVRLEVVGKSSAVVQVKLEPTGMVTRITVVCDVPDVWVSGEGVPPTILPRGGELTLPTPPVQLRFERAGFLPAQRLLPADTTLPVDCALGSLDERAPLVPVRVQAPPGVSVSIDGMRFSGGRLPAGRHLVSLSGPRLENSEQMIDVKPGVDELELSAREPGDALASERDSRRRLQLTAAVATTAAGVLSLGGAGALYAVNQGGYDEWRDDGKALAVRMRSTPSDVSAGDWNELLERENTLRNRDAAALGLAVLGGLLVSTGAVLWLTAPRPATSGVTLRIGKASSWLGYSATF